MALVLATTTRATSIASRPVRQSSQSSVKGHARAGTTEAISTVSPRPTRREPSFLAPGRVRRDGMRVGVTASQRGDWGGRPVHAYVAMFALNCAADGSDGTGLMSDKTKRRGLRRQLYRYE